MTPQQRNITIFLAVAVLLVCGFLSLLVIGSLLQTPKVVEQSASSPAPTPVDSAIPMQTTETPVRMTAIGLTPTAVPSLQATATWVIAPNSPPIPSGQNGIYVDAKNLVLSLQDIPPGFRIDQTQTRVISNQVSANSRLNSAEYLKTLDNWGRISGYEIAFTKEPSLSNLVGIFSIINIASQYKTSEGAHQSFSTIAGEIPSISTQISVPMLGDETFGMVTSQTTNNVKATAYSVSFRYRNIICSVITAGLAGMVGPDNTMELAQKLLQRVMQMSRS